MNKYIIERINAEMNEWMDKWMEKWMYESKKEKNC